MAPEVKKRVRKAREPDILDIKTDIAIAKFEQFGPKPSKGKTRKIRHASPRMTALSGQQLGLDAPVIGIQPRMHVG